MLLSRTAAAAAWMASNGGATTMSTARTSFASARSSIRYATVSGTVLYILKLPAISGLRMVKLKVES